MKFGDIVYLKPIGNNARRGSTEIREGEVTKVGRKYFEVKTGYSTEQFFLESNRHNNGQYIEGWKLYLSMDEVEYEKEYVATLRKIRDTFGGYSAPDLTLDQLRAIKIVIDSTESA